MKVVTYLAFTLFTIIINFAVMDFIQEKIRLSNASALDVNASSAKTHFNDILQQYGQKPHALYYRKDMKLGRNILSTKIYSNASLLESLETSTDISSTIIDLFYDENSSINEDTYTTVTESLLTSTEFDNVTEITLFGTKNATTGKPIIKPKKTVTKDCNCNLLYQVCDIDCCCDNDCTEDDRKIFNCVDGAYKKDQNSDGCISHLSFSNYLIGTGLDSLFCIVKTNLPDRRKLNRLEHDQSVIDRAFKWHSNAKSEMTHEFSRKPYKAGDPVWIFRNGSIYYIDLPALNLNSYCSSRKIMKFLRDEKITCNVKLNDLEIFHILNIYDESSVVSVTNKFVNTSTLNCSTLHCTEWAVIICDDTNCKKYNKTDHEQLCTESVCKNIAQRVDYTFYYYGSKITNATVKLFTQKISLNVPFIDQEVNVRFVLTNESVDNIVEFSGNPGYINSLPVIVSYNKNNYTDNFYNTSKIEKYLSHPENKHGICAISNITDNFVLFGHNRKIKCRYLFGRNKNETELCKNIQNNLLEILGLKKQVVVSPFGNPQNVKDDEWIPLKLAEIENPLYGNFNKNTVQCYNLIIGISYIFAYADASEVDTRRENKILSAKVEVIIRNVTFNFERNQEMSAVVSVATMFIDETKLSVYEYAGSPQLNIHLPKDFFFPFPSSEACVFKCNFLLYAIIITSVAVLSNK